jgi:signal transduction histidine kinase
VPVSRSRVLFVVVIGFVVTTLAFLSSSIADYLVASNIDDETSLILANALPSVRDVAHAHTALRELRESTSEAARTAPPRDMAEANRHWKELDAAVADEATTPWYPGELEVYYQHVIPALSDLRRALDEFEGFAAAPLDDPGLRDAAVRLERAENLVDATLEDLSEVNHEPAFAGAANIIRSHATFERLTLYLDIASTVVALVAAACAVKFARHFAATMRRNVQLEAERAQELDLVAQRIAHDLVSPLAAVSLSLGAIERQHKDVETERAVQRAQHVLDRSRRMVSAIYAFARSCAQPAGEAASPLRIAVQEAVGALLAAEAGEKRSGLTVDVQGFEEVEVKMDRGLLDVVLSNLLSNASKFTAKSPVRRITVRARVESTCVHVEVEDTGPGVPPSFAQHIFEPYKRAPSAGVPGLGLGLATVKRLVQAHGGAVGVRNAPEGGAVFWFELPRAPPRGAAAEAVGREEAAPRAAPLRPRPSS